MRSNVHIVIMIGSGVISMITRPTITPEQYRQKVKSGEIVPKCNPSRNPYKPATLLRGGHWLQEQDGQWYEFWDYNNYKALTQSEVINMLITEVNLTKERWVSERNKSY